MKVAFLLAFALVTVAIVYATEEVEREIRPVEQERACAGRGNACTDGDDCSCCDGWDKCMCNNPNKPGKCECVRAAIGMRWKKLAMCWG